MPKLPRSTSSATSSMASGTIPSRPAKPYPDRLKIMHLFPDRPLGGDRQLWRLVPQAVGDRVATGDSSWTLFFSSENFNGPVAFFPPATWSRISKRNLPAVGRGLDTRPARMDRGAMEFGIVPGLQANFGRETYLRIPKLLFPTEPYNGPKEELKGKLVTPLMQDVTLYSRQAIYKAVRNLFRIREATSGEFAATGAKENRFE